MTASAYILINVKSGRARKVWEELNRIKEITHIDAITGPFDFIAFITASDFNAIGRIVIDKIQSIPEIERTLTCNVIQFEQ